MAGCKKNRKIIQARQRKVLDEGLADDGGKDRARGSERRRITRRIARRKSASSNSETLEQASVHRPVHHS